MSSVDPSAAAPLVYDGTPVHRRGGLLNLLSMWRAAGRPPDRRVGDWLGRPDTQRLLSHLRITQPVAPVAALADIAGLRGIRSIEADLPLLTTRHRRQRCLWAPYQVALAYAQYLDPAFHAWCNEVVLRDGLAAWDEPAPADMILLPFFEDQFAQLQARFDSLEQQAGDLLFLVTAVQALMLGNRRAFTLRSRTIMRQVVALPPFDGACPCCGLRPVLGRDANPLASAQFDHFFHRALNRPELGWLICGPCHDDLGRGSYRLRFSKLPAFRRFQAALTAFRQAQHRPARPVS